uniref:Uncharacterized protein n=1 Tax=Manihot esculenta TaxID=3983 RepID=A0A2C9VMQ3_MANES
MKHLYFSLSFGSGSSFFYSLLPSPPVPDQIELPIIFFCPESSSLSPLLLVGSSSPLGTFSICGWYLDERLKTMIYLICCWIPARSGVVAFETLDP